MRKWLVVSLVVGMTGGAFAGARDVGRPVQVPALSVTHSFAGAQLHHVYHGGSVMASFYGHGEPLAKHTSNGEPFNPMGMTAAHRTLPIGTMVKVTYGDSSVVVRINDRGPAAFTGREIDLAYGAALKLTGFVARGSGPVGMAVLQ